MPIFEVLKNPLSMLFGAVVLVAVLTVVFSARGPFAGLLGIVQGECTFLPAQLGNVPADAVPSPLPFRVTVPRGTEFDQVLLPDIPNNAAAPTAGNVGYGWIEPGTNTSGTFITADYHRTLTIDGVAYTISAETAAFQPFGTSCNPETADRAPDLFNHPATTDAGYATDQAVGFIGDEALSTNPYAGILLTLFMLVPLGMLVYAAIRALRD